MGTYNIGQTEFDKLLQEFLLELEGEVTVEVMAMAWNRLANMYGWGEFLFPLTEEYMRHLKEVGKEPLSKGGPS